MMAVETLVTLAVRAGLVVLFFPASALDKIFNFKSAVAQSAEVFKPRTLAAVVILAGLCIEILMPLGILSGFADRLAAFVLAGYCTVTAILFKRFWQPGDFWASGDSKARNLFWDFLKNLSLASGFLLISVGPNGAGLAQFLGDPLGSSHPYAAAEPSHAR